MGARERVGVNVGICKIEIDKAKKNRVQKFHIIEKKNYEGK
jgi:hypothetical protein